MLAACSTVLEPYLILLSRRSERDLTNKLLPVPLIAALVGFVGALVMHRVSPHAETTTAAP